MIVQPPINKRGCSFRSGVILELLLCRVRRSEIEKSQVATLRSKVSFTSLTVSSARYRVNILVLYCTVAKMGSTVSDGLRNC